jgi:photosystem II stability/assembly factor-like uncharacterized protein
MKRISTLFKSLILISIYLFLGSSNSFSQSNLDSGLVAYYPFNGNANDESGNGNNGTDYGATLTTDRFGTFGYAFSFNGTSNYINKYPASFIFNYNSKFTVSAWFNPSILSGTRQIVSHLTEGSGNFVWNATIQNGSLIFGATRQMSDWYNATYLLPVNALNTWQHVVGVYDNTSMKLYYNGVLVDNTTFGYTNTTAASLPINIGADQFGSMSNFFSGSLDDIRIYNRALSDAEILQLYNIENTAPVTQLFPVTIILPQDSSTAITSPVNFFWSKSPLALAYTIQISTNNIFSSTVVNQSISDTTYSTSVPQMSTRYFWRVRAEKTDGASNWIYAIFTTKLNIPSLVNPVTGAIDVNLKPSLSWGSVLSSAKYSLQLSLQPDFSTITRSIDTTLTTVVLDSLSRATTYYWRVRAYINGDTTDYSNPSNFITIPFSPVTPNLIYPPDASTIIPVNAVLRWSKIQNAVSYKLQVSTSPIFSTLFKDSSFTDTLYRPKPFFNSNTQYYWRVSSTNGAGTSNYSGTFRYITGIDTNKSKISYQNINLGTVTAGTVTNKFITISNTGTDDLIVYSFSNQLSSWTAVNTGLTHTNVLALAVSGMNLFAGTNGSVFLSTNSGSRWTAVNTGLPQYTIVNTLVVSGTNLFAGTYGDGVFYSTNNGTNWNAVNTGLTNANIYTLAVSGTNLFAGTDVGVFLSTNNGTSWMAVNTGLPITHVWSLAVSGTNLFAGSGGSGVFLSNNNGTSWTVINSGLTSRYIVALAISGTNLFAGTEGGIILSTNNGTSWTAVNNNIPNIDVHSFAVSGSNLFVGTNTSSVLLSTNNGSSWTAINSGLTISYVNTLVVYGTNLFAGTNGGVYRSAYIDLSPSISTSIISPDASTTASIHLNSMPVGSMNGKIIVISNAPSSPDTITVTGFGAIYGLALNSNNINMGTVKIGLTKDTLITIANTGNDNLVISSIASDNPSFSVLPSTLTIAPGASVKDTIRFTPTTTGNVTGKIIITSNLISPDTITVIANGSLTNVTNTVAIPKEYSLSQNFPNPYNPSTTIQYGLPARSAVRIVIYNILGQVVKELINSEQPAGIQSVVWNANNASGLYFYKLEATSLDNPGKRFVETKKMLLLK